MVAGTEAVVRGRGRADALVTILKIIAISMRDGGSIIIPKPANIGIRTFVSVGHALSAATWHMPVRVKSWSLPPLWSFQRAPEELDEEGWALRPELVDRESHISLLALTNSR
jgi:hypothetical protein